MLLDADPLSDQIDLRGMKRPYEEDKQQEEGESNHLRVSRCVFIDPNIQDLKQFKRNRIELLRF